MDTTDRHGLPYLIADQAQKHVTVNEAVRALDALVQMSVRSAQVTQEPDAPQAGEGYILPAGRTGPAWGGLPEQAVAVWQDGAWAHFAARPGLTVYVEDEGAHRVWDGSAWTALAGGSGLAAPEASAPTFGVNAEGDATNRLTVKSDAVLHSHDDVTPGSGDVRHVLNKADSAGTASFVFQSDYSGRAELGLTGSDDFAFKVSPDGVTFHEALRIDRNTGAVTLPATPSASGAGSDAATVAAAFTDGLSAALLANGGVGGGNLARTKQIVLATSTGKVQIGSAEDGNRVEVYDSGAELAAGTVRQRLFLRRGEIAVLDGLNAGAVITSTAGIAGSSETSAGPMPLGLEGFAAEHFFFYAYRDSEDGKGQVFVAAGAVPASVKLMSGDGGTVIDEAEVDAFGLATLFTDADAELQVVADRPVFVGVAARMDAAAPAYWDLRLVPPLSTELIGYGTQGRVSALYPDTTIRWYRRDGTSGTLTAGPGYADLLSATGANDPDYEADACLILRADGPISGYSGADTSGVDATPFFPLSALSQRVPLPLAGHAYGDGSDNGIAVASPHEGTARLYLADGSLFATIPLTRGGTVVAPADQLCPCAGLAAKSDPEATTVLPAAFEGGYVEADVPIYVVQNANGNETVIAGGIKAGAKETALPGITPEDIRAEIRRDEAGFLRRRRIDGSGAETWVLC